MKPPATFTAIQAAGRSDMGYIAFALDTEGRLWAYGYPTSSRTKRNWWHINNPNDYGEDCGCSCHAS